MGAFGVVVIAVLVVAIVVGLLLLRQPVNWDEVGGGGFDSSAPASSEHAPPIGQPPSRAADEADLRALIERKRAARHAREGTAPVPRPLAQGPPWAHMESEVVEEARALVQRRRDRLARQGKADVDEHSELVRLLGPPHV